MTESPPAMPENSEQTLCFQLRTLISAQGGRSGATSPHCMKGGVCSSLEQLRRPTPEDNCGRCRDVDPCRRSRRTDHQSKSNRIDVSRLANGTATLLMSSTFIFFLSRYTYWGPGKCNQFAGANLVAVPCANHICTNLGRPAAFRKPWDQTFSKLQLCREPEASRSLSQTLRHMFCTCEKVAPPG